eukprot:m.36631 g.36631  ORF g.36631 m.36631 type:complete len:254 (-) comp5426_c0_seq2:308-1069(-)
MAPQAVKPEAVLYGVIGGFLTIPLVLGYVFGWYAAVAVIMLWYAPFPSFVKRYSAMWMLYLAGFRYEDRSGHGLQLPRDIHKLPDKCVVIGEPHTHIWDFMAMQLFFAYYGMPLVHVLVSTKYTKIPVLRWVLLLMGALEVDTESGKKGGKVAQAVAELNRVDKMVLHVPPSGTRQRTEFWKSGFYHIAKLGKIPLICAWLDASTGTFGFEAPLYLTDDAKADMDKVREFYKDKRGFVPENESVVRLQNEEDE